MRLSHTILGSVRVYSLNRYYENQKTEKIHGLNEQGLSGDFFITYENVYNLKYGGTTGMVKVTTSDQRAADLIQLVYGYALLIVSKDGMIEKYKLTQGDPKLIYIPVGENIKYGVYALNSPTIITIKKNYKRYVAEKESMEEYL